jgi:hypothetical protein
MASDHEAADVLRTALAQRARDFEEARGRRYSDEDVASDEDWAREMSKYRTIRCF